MIVTGVPAAPRAGRCACGAVWFEAQGAPIRAGICHCRVCQKVHGAAFYAFAVFERDRVQLTGDILEWRSSARYTRLACAACGSRLGGRIGTELELSLPLFDTPGSIKPQYESWVIRRVPWLPALEVTQYKEDRLP